MYAKKTLEKVAEILKTQWEGRHKVSEMYQIELLRDSKFLVANLYRRGKLAEEWAGDYSAGYSTGNKQLDAILNGGKVTC